MTETTEFARCHLKLKYRQHGWVRPHITGEPPGLITKVYQAGKFTSKTNNSGKAQRPIQGQGPRRRQGLGFTGGGF